MRSTPSSRSTLSSNPPVPQSAYATKIAWYCSRDARISSRTAPGIFSGRLCSSAGRQRTLSSSQRLARRSAVISCANAPQAMISSPPPLRAIALMCSMRRGAGPTSCDQPLGRLDCNGGIAAIRIRADGFAEFLVERRAADEDDVVVADPSFLQRIDNHLHVRHGRRQQRRHAQNVGLVFGERIEVFLHGIVDAKIDDLEARPL